MSPPVLALLLAVSPLPGAEEEEGGGPAGEEEAGAEPECGGGGGGAPSHPGSRMVRWKAANDT